MKCVPADTSRPDVAQWLHGGWFFWRSRDDAEMQPAQMEPGDGTYVVTTIGGETHSLRRQHCFPFWPACGAVNLDGFAVYAERSQVRQWRRTYNSQCVSVTVPRKWDVMKRNGPEVVNVGPNTKDVVRALFNPKYYTYSEAVEMMDTGQAVSVALNRTLIVAGPLVYYRNKLVAKIRDQKIVPVGVDVSRINRILKFFEGRVSI